MQLMVINVYGSKAKRKPGSLGKTSQRKQWLNWDLRARGNETERNRSFSGRKKSRNMREHDAFKELKTIWCGWSTTLYPGRMMAGHKSFACYAKETRFYPKDNGKSLRGFKLRSDYVLWSDFNFRKSILAVAKMKGARQKSRVSIRIVLYIEK